MSAAVMSAAAMRLLVASKERACKLADEVARAAAAVALRFAAHELVESEALPTQLAYAGLADARVSHTPSPPARSPVGPSTPLVPSDPSGLS